MDVLHVSGLTKRFGAVTANDAIDLRVGAGEVVGLLGHNGAGKTTLISQVVGLLRPDAGSIRVGAVNAVADPATARTLVALQAQGQAPLDGLTPRRAIELTARIRGLTRSEARRAAQRIADELDITGWLDRRALPDGRGISGGVRRLVSFAMTVAVPAPLVVLDEPTNDVDASRRPRLWKTVRRLADEGAGVLLVTHNVAEAERVVDHLVVLEKGRVVAHGTPAQLRGTADTDVTLELHLPAGGDHEAAALPIPPMVVHQQVIDGRRLRLTIPSADAATAVAWAARLRTGGDVEGFTLSPTTLEDTYLALTTTGQEPAQELSDV
jgi:ABC-2 type transport system ATP-binding protein